MILWGFNMNFKTEPVLMRDRLRKHDEFKVIAEKEQ